MVKYFEYSHIISKKFISTFLLAQFSMMSLDGEVLEYLQVSWWPSGSFCYIVYIWIYVCWKDNLMVFVVMWASICIDTVFALFHRESDLFVFLYRDENNLIKHEN